MSHIHIIHENEDWTAPLLRELDALGHPYREWHLGDGRLTLDEIPPAGIFYSRMSASSHTRGHRYTPELTAGVLAWLEAHGARVLNGTRALALEVSKMAQYAALITFWPYNLEFTFANYDFDLANGGGWDSYFNSIRLSIYTAVVGTAIIFFGAYLVEKGRGFTAGRNAFHAVAMIPLAVPGMALGLAYIFFFNNPANPFNFLYGTMGILVVVTVTHFYTVSHLTAVTALKQMDPEFESVSEEPSLCHITTKSPLDADETDGKSWS